MRPTFFASFAASLALLLASCGGGPDTSTYVQQVGKIQTDARYQSTQINEDIQDATTPKQIAAKLTTLGEGFGTNADKLAALQVPDEMQDLHERYVKLLRDLGVSINGLAERVSAAKPADAKKIFAESRSITDSFQAKEQQLLTDINKQLAG